MPPSPAPMLPLACAAVAFAIGAFSADSSAAPRNSVRATAPRMARTRPAPPPALAPDADVPAESREEGGIFGPLRVGPLAGVSVPRPLSVALFMKYKRAVGLGLEYSVLPTLTVDGVSVHASAIAGDLRWFILDSPVFLGVGMGVQSLKGAATISGYSGSADASKVFVTPRIGMLWTFASGFSIGADAGIELVVSHDETVVPDIEEIRNNAFVAALTRGPLPDVHVLRMGWLF